MTRKASWAMRQRQAFIAARLEAYGFIRRDDLVNEFDISIPQASIDFQRYKRENPGAIFHNVKSMRYERAAKSTVGTEIAEAIWKVYGRHLGNEAHANQDREAFISVAGGIALQIIAHHIGLIQTAPKADQ